MKQNTNNVTTVGESININLQNIKFSNKCEKCKVNKKIINEFFRSSIILNFFKQEEDIRLNLLSTYDLIFSCYIITFKIFEEESNNYFYLIKNFFKDLNNINITEIYKLNEKERNERQKIEETENDERKQKTYEYNIINKQNLNSLKEQYERKQIYNSQLTSFDFIVQKINYEMKNIFLNIVYNFFEKERNRRQKVETNENEKRNDMKIKHDNKIQKENIKNQIIKIFEVEIDERKKLNNEEQKDFKIITEKFNDSLKFLFISIQQKFFEDERIERKNIELFFDNILVSFIFYLKFFEREDKNRKIIIEDEKQILKEIITEQKFILKQKIENNQKQFVEYKNAKNIFKETKLEFEKSHEKFKDYKQLKSLFLPKGYSLFIIENFRKVIESYINKKIRSFSDELLFEIIIEESFTNIYLNQNDMKISIDLASGFQKSLVGLLFRLAFIKFSCNCGNLLIIDEGFVSFDINNLTMIPIFLKKITDEIRGIYIITHLENLKTNMDHVYEINKDEYSKIKLIR